MKKLNVLDLVVESMIAAIYFTLVVIPIFTPFSFALVQFRIAEVLMVLVLFHKKHTIGLVIGCLVANYYGLSAGMTTIYDVIFGTLATLFACYAMILFKKHWYIAFLMPAIFNGIIIGFVLSYAFTDSLGPLYVTIPSVFLGEFVVLYVLGAPLYFLLKRRSDINTLLTR